MNNQNPEPVAETSVSSPERELEFPHSTCVECGKKIPSGDMQKCEFGSYCSWRVPKAVRDFISYRSRLSREESATQPQNLSGLHFPWREIEGGQDISYIEDSQDMQVAEGEPAAIRFIVATCNPAILSSATQPTESADQAYERGQRTMLHRVNSILKEHGEKGFLLSNQKYFPPPAPKGGS